MPHPRCARSSRRWTGCSRSTTGLDKLDQRAELDQRAQLDLRAELDQRVSLDRRAKTSSTVKLAYSLRAELPGSTVESMSSTTTEPKSVRSLVPARMDRLPWTRFHWMIVVGLGISWVLDGLEIQIIAANGFAGEFKMDSAQVGAAGTIYLLGQVIGRASCRERV